LIGDFDKHGGGAEHFLLQHFVAVDQQAHIGLEQLRPRLIARLGVAGQMLDAGVRAVCPGLWRSCSRCRR
jgi:hypothetical protein